MGYTSKSLFIIGMLSACLLTSCLSPQQVHQRRIENNLELFNTFTPEVKDKILLGQVDLGFNQEMVALAWGSPHRIYNRITKDETVMIWAYYRIKNRMDTERVRVPVYDIDDQGRRVVDYEYITVNRDSQTEYVEAKVEFSKGLVTAIERLGR